MSVKGNFAKCGNKSIGLLKLKQILFAKCHILSFSKQLGDNTGTSSEKQTQSDKSYLLQLNSTYKQ